MNKLVFFLFLLFSVFSIACSDAISNPCDKCNSEQYCTSGVCLSYKCSTEHPKGACKSGNHCDGTQCVASICSAEYPKGQCASDDEHCVSGVCEAYGCSFAHPNGICPNGQVCLANHQCGDIDCSKDNPNGQCENGSVCNSEGKCELAPCSAQSPNGKCDDTNQECVAGTCLYKDRCTVDNPLGSCSLHQRCVEGTCKDIDCGPGNPDGACPDGKFCERVLSSGEWTYSCKDVPTSCTDNSDCPEEYKCEDSKCVEYVCDPECSQYQICKYGICQDDPFFCSVDSQNGWCEDGLECIDGSCQVHVYNPCEGVDCGNNYCIVTDPNSDTGYECVTETELCSESNTTGKCNAPQVCKDGVCSDPNPCDNKTCNEGEVCDPTNGACVENYCQAHPTACTEDHTMCVNKFGDTDKFFCPCELGYEYSYTEHKCNLRNDACTGKDCGEGVCITDDWAVDGWYCECNGPSFDYLDENVKHLCIDPATYDYCTGWDCGVGTCQEVTEDTHKYAICDCPDNFIFDSTEKTCKPGITCGSYTCDPLKEACVNNTICEQQPCSGNYPEGACGNAESCVPCDETGDNDGCNGGMKCELTEECSASTSAGYCMDGYSCRTGICCKGGNCTTTDATLKHVNETCNLDTNNCVNDAICVPTPTGEGVCHKLCDQTQVNSCDALNTGDTVYHCVGRNVFDGINYDRIGVCAVDDNCNKTDNSGCYSNQVCLSFRRTNFDQCYGFEENTHLGMSCSTSTVSIVIDDNGHTRPGFNVGCGENLLCVDGTCVPDCFNKHKFTDIDVNLCYDSFTQTYKTGNLKVKDRDNLTFESVENHTDISTCDPSNNTCSNGDSCIKVQDNDSVNPSSKDIGFCSQTCNFDSSNYKNECAGSNVCFKSGNNSICLASSDCNPINSQGCGESVCYPVTSTKNSCMTKNGLAHIGEDCTGVSCQEGLCVNGVCAYPCAIGDNSSCNLNEGETCQSTTDAYLNNSSHFGTPSTYGTCQ